tara:strand:+ start:462 stop:2231 length:1770 start_codon:yes stop_codon:yes gene_type:complete
VAKKNKDKYQIKTSTHALLKRIVRDYLSNYKFLFSMSLICMLISAAMTAALAKLMEPMIDEVFTAKDQSMLLPVSVMIFGAFLLRGFSTYGHTVLMNKVGQSIVATIQSQLFGHLLRLDLTFYHNNPSGTLISRVVNDVTLMRQSVAECFTGIGKSTLTLLFLTIVMFYQDWKLALGAFFVFPASAYLVARIGKRLRNVSGDTQEGLAYFSSMLGQVFQGVRQVKAYGREEYEQSRADAHVNRLYKLVHKAVRVSALTTPMTEVLTGLAMVTVVAYGGYQVIIGESTTGSLFSFITAFMLAYDPMKRLAKLNNSLQMGLAAGERVFDILDRKTLIHQLEDAKDLKIDKGEIEFEEVNFNYPDGTAALKNINLKIEAGKTVALVGLSGSGKSTMINLIPRFYDVTSGDVLIDGQSVRDVTLSSLRNSMALVTQEVAIFNDTVYNNIAYGLEDASKEQIIEAATKAAAHDFIMALPEGYETVVGEQGLKLSGGQRQRLSIARAMLRSAPILLLDEATSALDNESERLVQEALGVLQMGRTTVVIAHRLSTIINADLICVLENGSIIEQGNHDELLKKGGAYKRFYDLQLGS